MKYNSRKFLNKQTGLAAIQLSADVQSSWADITVNISDCNRQVSLDFCFRSVKGYKDQRAKLQLLINELVLLRDAVDVVMSDADFRHSMK